MTAIATDRNTPQKAGDIRSIPVAANTTIYLGTLVATNSSGYLVSAADNSALKYAGVAAEGVDNSTGADAALSCKVYRGRIHEFVSSGLGVADVGKPLYVSDNQTVSKTPTNMHCGHLAEYKSATVAPVDISSAIYDSPDEEILEDLPVAGSTTITAGNMVCIKPDGYLTNAADTRGYVFAGIAQETVNNGAGADGDLTCLVRRDGIHALTGASLVAVDAGKPVWVSNATTVKVTPGNVFVGIMAKVASATSARVDISPAVDGQHPDVDVVPVAATTTIVAGTGICMKTDGYCVPMANTATYKFVGVALEGVDNSTGSDGDKNVRIWRGGIWNFTASSLAVTDAGKPVYVSNATTVTTTVGNGVLVGKLVNGESATVAPVDIGYATQEPHNQRGRFFTLCIFWPSTVGTSPVTAMEDWECPVAFKVLRGYAKAGVAPGSGYNCTITITDGTTAKTLTIAGTATKGENEAIDTIYAADTDMDVTLVDDNGSAATANVMIVFDCETV